MRSKLIFLNILLTSSVLLLVLLTACTASSPPPIASVEPTLISAAALSWPRTTRAVPPTYTPLPLPTAAPFRPVPTMRPTTTPLPSPTFGPYTGLTITDLSQRTFGGGQLEIVEELDQTAAFTRYLVRYPSDGLTIYGFMNVPVGEGPFPVVVALHGYVNPEAYNTLDYTSKYADHLATNDYLVLHPNFRNYPPSDSGPNQFRIGYAIDTLNLLALIEAQAGRPGPLQVAAPDNVHLWGHSMGGGVVLRVLTVNTSIRSAILYGSMSADEYLNFEKVVSWSEGADGQEELQTPPEWMARIAPIHYLYQINAAVSIHHGYNDGVVPVTWSAALCEELRSLGNSVQCHFYSEQPHNFVGEGDRLFRRRVLDFLDQHSD